MADTESDPLYAALLAGYDPLDTVERLALLRPTWHLHAACRGLGPELRMGSARALWC